jgi:hypothetical protein
MGRQPELKVRKTPKAGDFCDAIGIASISFAATAMLQRLDYRISVTDCWPLAE